MALPFDAPPDNGVHSTSANPSRINCTKYGQVTLNFQGEFTAAAGVRQFRVMKRTGGTDFLVARVDVDAASEGNTALSLTALSTCGYPGDYFFVQAYQKSGGGALELVTANYYSPLVTFRLSRQ